MKSNPSSLPFEFAEALDRARGRLGRLGGSIQFYRTVESTNDVAASVASDVSPSRADVRDAEGIVVTADAQTAGRGRRGRTWFSPPASGLYVSVVLAPARSPVDPDRATRLLTLAAGVALAEAIEIVSGLRVQIKWPNDLLVEGRKLAGILAEATPPFVILGYGINVGPAAYPPELGHRASSLEVELGRPIDRAALFVETLATVARRYDDLLAGRFDAILDAWRSRAPGSRGARVTWTEPSGVRTGVTAGIDDQGALLVRVGVQIERIVAGEVTWV